MPTALRPNLRQEGWEAERILFWVGSAPSHESLLSRTGFMVRAERSRLRLASVQSYYGDALVDLHKLRNTSSVCFLLNLPLTNPCGFTPLLYLVSYAAGDGHELKAMGLSGRNAGISNTGGVPYS